MNSTASRSSSADRRHDEPRPISVADVTYRATTFVYEAPPRTQVQVTHDRRKKLFRVTDPRGATAVFQDQPVRFLVVQPDSRTGNMAPVLACGEAKYLYLCREMSERPSAAARSREARRSRNGAARRERTGSNAETVHATETAGRSRNHGTQSRQK
jgi:hypothetical protein